MVCQRDLMKSTTGQVDESNNSPTIWEALQTVKPLFREPKQRTEMEATLSEYSNKAESSRRGALWQLLVDPAVLRPLERQPSADICHARAGGEAAHHIRG